MLKPEMTSILTAPLTSRTVRIGTREIFLQEAGHGPALLLLHGGGPGASGVANFERNIGALAANFRVIVPDMPGYGRSTKGLSRTDPFGDLADAMHALLDQLGIARAHAVGNSLGGACALRMALDRPRRIGRLVLMGPGGIDTTRSLPTAGLKHLLDYYSGEGPTVDKLRTFITEYLVFDGSRIPEEVIQQRFQASIDPGSIANPPLRRPKGIPQFKKIDFTRDGRLQSLANPTLVLWGTEDKVNRPSGGMSLQRRMPNCDLHMFSRTGHWVQWERPEEFNALVTTYLGLDAVERNEV